MTKRVTISLPDDVAGRLEQEPNASAYVTTALRRQIDRETALAELVEHFGPALLEDASRARGRARLAEAREKVPPERFAALRERYGLRPAS